ncbi:MAG: 50S ribosomal protein L1 [Candidatus Njordarchaeales archaeon]
MSISERELYNAVLKTIHEMRKISPKRNFTEAVEVQIALKDYDLTKPENRFRARITLPYSIAKKDKIAVFADDPHIPPLRELAEKKEITLIDKAGIEELKSNIRKMKKIARRHRIFVSSATLMGIIGRYFGRLLSPRNKMPIPVGITDDIVKAIDMAKRTVLVRLHKSPTVHAKVGSIDMPDEQLAENIVAFVMDIKNRLPKGWRNIRNIVVKTTMGPPIKVELEAKKRK